MKKLSLLAFLLFATVSGSTFGADGVGYPVAKSGYKKLDIHYYFGYGDSRPISIQHAREISQTEITSTDSNYIIEFLKWLHLEKMQRVSSIDLNDTRAFIVIDLYRTDDGGVETLFSDGDYLYSVNPSMKSAVDKEFRTKFYFSPEQGELINVTNP